MSASPTIEVRRVAPDDPAAEPMMAELLHEYTSRYGPGAIREMTRHSPSLFTPPGGTLLLLLENGVAIAGGAFKAYDERTAEAKRIWTAAAHRRRGLARRVMAELERAAVEAGYDRMYLTTGPRQPEAVRLYLATGYTPLFDVAQPPTDGPLPFEKALG
ncbi:GNAT family N-acetyltransferase [Actinosynnema sp. NPDC020468]|uniref:GNAT family N-acetyltransferase n=1 Tax=Actinosynnema sp. NPDC020468 TaxID=3154488 RepID=UPI003400364C